MKIMRTILLIFPLLAILAASSAQAEMDEKVLNEALEYIVQGDTETAKVGVSVKDCETDKPVFGAQVTLRYQKKVSGSQGSIFEDLGSCRGEASGTTDEKGRVKLDLTVTKCPHAFIGAKEEERGVSVSAWGYEMTGKNIKNSQVNICLEKAAWEFVSPPIAILYSKYLVDLERYGNVFHSIQEINKRNLGEKLPKHSYVAWRYASARGLGDEGFSGFLEKIGDSADIGSMPLLKEILVKEYPLPYKSFKTSDEESWRAGDYVYGLGQKAAARAIVNIADDRLSDLLPLAVDVPEPYLVFLRNAGVALNSEIYWEYLTGKYASRQGLFAGEGNMRPDPLVFTLTLLKEQVPKPEYERTLVSFYLLLNRLRQATPEASKQGESMRNYDVQRYLAAREKVAKELIKMKSSLFAIEVIKVLADMDVNDMTRSYLQYLYDAGEHKAIAEALKDNKNLMRAFLGLDIIDQRDNPPRYYYREDEKKSHLAKMPKVARAISGEIEHFIGKEMKRSVGLASWSIQNIAEISRTRADALARDLYHDPQSSVEAGSTPSEGVDKKKIKKHTGSQARYARQSALVGAAEARLPGLCTDIYDELDISRDLSNDYFSLGYYRVRYLKNACSVQMGRLVKDFDYRSLIEKSKNKHFEESYEHHLPEAIRDYFPKDRADKLLNDYYSGTEEDIQRIYSGSKYPPRYQVPYLCQRFEKDLSSMASYRASTIIDYLDACYPEKKKEHERYRRSDSGSESGARTYEAFREMTREKRGTEYHFPVPVYEKRFRSLFVMQPAGQKREKEAGQQERYIDQGTAFSIVKQGIGAEDKQVQQAALYALAWFPAGRPVDLVNAVRSHARGDLYPHYLYAAYSLALVEPGSEVVRSACGRAAAHHISLIEKRTYAPDPPLFAFNSLKVLDLCRMTGHAQQYERLLDLLLQPGTVGRYEGYDADLERIIVTSSVSNSTMNRLLDSNRPPDIVLAIRLAEIKNAALPGDRLLSYLNHSDSYVRRAAASYIIANKLKYPELLGALKNNSNRIVREMSRGTATK